MDDRQSLLIIRLYEGAPDAPREALDLLADELSLAGGRDRASISIQTRQWTTDAQTKAELAGQVPSSFLDNPQRAVLRIYWFNGTDGTGGVVKPGTIALFANQLPLGENASRGTLLHHAGHALGLVNLGIPMQQNHEAPPPHHGHVTDAQAVMQWGFEIPGYALANAPYDSYGPAIRADLAGAVKGVCA